MKKSSVLSLLALFFAVSMLVFTFFTCGWFYLDNRFEQGTSSGNTLPIQLENSNGFQFGFEIPIGTKNGFLSTLSDCIWTFSPFLMILSIALSFFLQGEKAKRVSFFLAGVPAVLYPLSQMILFLTGKDVHFTFLITLFFLLAVGGLTLFGIFHPEVRPFAWQVALFHVGLEILLLILSLIFREKYSFFYFSEYFHNGNLWSRFHYFIFSVFVYYISYSLSIAFLHLSQNRKAPRSPKYAVKEETGISLPFENEAEQESPETEENEDPAVEEEIPLSLEDLGMER